jgi:hypothetical protein
MKLLIWLGMGFFFVHYYIVLAFALLKNAVFFIWNAAKQTPEKLHISPFAATHPLVFAPVRTHRITQTISYRMMDLPSNSIASPLMMAQKSPCGGCARKGERGRRRFPS